MADSIKVICDNLGGPIRVAMGTPLSDVAAQLTPGRYPFLAAFVNNRIKELNYKIYTPVTVRFVDITDFAGIRVYQRTSWFILQKAARTLFPGHTLHIRHSMGQSGFYCEIDGIEWIRLLYCYPDKITDELIDTMASQPKVLHYIDLPLQHADDKILKAMNRHSTAEETREVIRKLRERMPDIAIRTTFIVGFPGEGDDEFETLAEFVNEEEFERLGCFEYSPQEGTPAAKMENQVDDDVKSRRAEVIMQDQYEIMTEKNNNMIGKTLRVLTESYDDYTDSYSGRSYMDAPDIDGKIIFTSSDFIKEGEFVDVEILGVNEYDLLGRTVK